MSDKIAVGTRVLITDPVAHMIDANTYEGVIVHYAEARAFAKWPYVVKADDDVLNIDFPDTPHNMSAYVGRGTLLGTDEFEVIQ